MATSVEQRIDSPTGSDSPTTEYRSRPNSGRKGGQWVFFGLLAVGVIGGGTYAVQSLTGGGGDGTVGAITHTVKKERLLITVTEDGNLESASNVTLKCRIAGGSTILWIVEDGKIVKKGEELVHLDESSIEDQVNAQKIVYEKALATKIQAEEDYEAAKIAVEEYRDGTYIQAVQDAEAAIIIAEQNLSAAKDALEYTKRMVRKGFATPLQLEADQFAKRQTELELKSAELAKKTLTEFTYAKTLRELEAARDAAEARKRSEQAAFDLEKARLDRLEEQLQYCVITAPQAGMAVYANDTGRRSQTPDVEEGAVVREGQDLIKIPDLSNMQVKVTVHESKVDMVVPGMPARIVVQGQEYDGNVVSVANQPEPGSWFSSNVKEYATIVSIDGQHEVLKPGMTAEVEILIADLKDAITVPVGAVVEQRNKFFAWVQTSDGPQKRLLDLGRTNDKVIEVKDGVKIGDVVLLNPRAVVEEARAYDLETDEESGKNRFKDAKAPDGVEAGEGGNAGPKGRKNAKNSGRKGRGNLMALDKDGDGKISKEEAPDRMKENFDRMDSNGDGFITTAEVQSAAAAFQKKAKAGGPGGPGGPAGGPSP